MDEMGFTMPQGSGILSSFSLHLETTNPFPISYTVYSLHKRCPSPRPQPRTVQLPLCLPPIPSRPHHTSVSQTFLRQRTSELSTSRLSTHPLQRSRVRFGRGRDLPPEKGLSELSNALHLLMNQLAESPQPKWKTVGTGRRQVPAESVLEMLTWNRVQYWGERMLSIYSPRLIVSVRVLQGVPCPNLASSFRNRFQTS